MDEKDRSSGWIGAILASRWRIESKIARGGVATVFRARTPDGQLGAVKIMHPQFARNPDVRSRFLREGYAANKVGHPDVVRILEAGTAQDGSPFLVMELLEDGEPLEARRERLGGRLPLDEVARAADQLLGILASAHAQGIIHRDIKAENLFAMADGTLKVLDFGIAQIKEAAAQNEPTATGLLLGTPEFMSPEQALGKRGLVDAQSDIYSVGASLFTLLSGEAVHVYDSLPLLLNAVAMRQARSLASVAFKGLPREVIAIVDKALALEKPRRWASATAMREALRKALPWAAEKARLVPAPKPRVASVVSGGKKIEPVDRPVPVLFRESEGTMTAALLGSGDRPALSAPKPPSGRSWAPTPEDGVRAARISKLPPAMTPGAGVRAPRPPRDVPVLFGDPPSSGGGDSGTLAMAPLAPPALRTVIRPPVRYDTMVEEEGARTEPEAWGQEFAQHDMEGPTVALTAPPVQPSQSPITPRMAEPESADTKTTMDLVPPDVAMHGDFPADPLLTGPFAALPPIGDPPLGAMYEPSPLAMREPTFPPMIVAPPVPDERTQTAHFALVGLAIVVVLSGLVGAFLYFR